MACLDFEHPAPLVRSAVQPPPRALSASDRHILAAAGRDPLSSIGPEAWMLRTLRRLVRSRPTTLLADDRLEALRRFGVLVRFGRDDEMAVNNLLSSGYGTEQIVEVRRFMALSMARKSPRPGRALLLMAAGLLAWAVTMYLVNLQLDDALMAFIVVSLLGLEPLIFVGSCLLGSPEHRLSHY